MKAPAKGPLYAVLALVVLALLGVLRAFWPLALGAGALALSGALFLLVRRRQALKAWLSLRRIRLAFGASIQTLLVLALAVLAYVILAVSGADVSRDVTAQRRNSLSPLTLALLSRVDFPVQVEYFSDKLREEPALEMLRRFAKANRNIRWSFVDMVGEPLRVRERHVEQAGTLVFLSGARPPLRLYGSELMRRTSDAQGRPIDLDISEERIAAVLLGFIEGERVPIAFLSGHGEKRTDEAGENGLTRLRESLRLANFLVENIDLGRSSLPESTRLLAIVGPREPLEPLVEEKLSAFLGKGGSLFLCLDPKADTQRRERSWEDFSRKYGVVFRDDLVIDASDYLMRLGSAKGSPVYPILEFTAAPVLEPLRQRRLDTVFFTARSVELQGDTPGEILLRTGENAVGIASEIKPGARLSFDPTRDQKGPLTVAALAAVGKAPGRNGGKFAAFGDSDFLRNPLLEVSGHRDLAVSLLRDLAGKKAPFMLPQSEEERGRLVIGEAESRWVRGGALIVFPGLVLLTGLALVRRRRRLSHADPS